MSQLDNTKTTLNGQQYEMSPLPPELSLDLMTDVISILSPTVLPLITKIFSGSKGDAEDIMGQKVDANLFSGLSFEIQAPEFKRVRRDLASAFAQVTQRNGNLISNTQGGTDAVFLGNIGEYLQWIVWGCEVQWGKSLSALLPARLFQGAQGNQSGSQPPST